MLRNLRPIKFSEHEVKINGKDTIVPADYEAYVEDGFWDFLRFNKKARKRWVPLLVEGFNAFNALVDYDLSEKAFDDHLAKIEKLIKVIDLRLDNLERVINIRRGKKGDKTLKDVFDKANESLKGETALNYKNEKQKDFNISLGNFHGMIKNEVAEYNYLKQTRKNLVAQYEKLKQIKANKDSQKPEEKKQFESIQKQLKTNGRVSHRDDVYSDASVFDYSIPPAYSHPFNKYEGVSHADLMFAIDIIYSNQKEGNGGGLESLLEIQRDFLSSQGHFWATSSTRKFTQQFGQLLYVKGEEVKQTKHGLAQSAYDRLVRDLLDEEVLPEESFEKLSTFVEKNGKFTTYVLDRKELDHALQFAHSQLKKLSKPWFAFARREASEKYNCQKTLLETTIHNLESYTFDTRALIDSANDKQNTSFTSLIESFNTQPHVNVANSPLRLNRADDLLKTSATGEYSNLKSFLGFLEKQEQELTQKNKKAGFFKKRFDIFGRKEYQEDQEKLAFIQKFKQAAVISQEAQETMASTDKIKLVVDSEEKKQFIERYNAKRVAEKKHVLHTGSSVQLIEDRIYYKPQEKIAESRETLVKNNLFEKMLKAYNAYREQKEKPIIPYAVVGEEAEVTLNRKKAYEEMRKNHDFSDFLANLRQKNEKDHAELKNEPKQLEKRKEEDQQLDEYLVAIQIDMGTVDDRFLQLVQAYNAYRLSHPKEGRQPIKEQNLIACPVDANDIASDRTARHDAYEQLRKEGDFSQFVQWYKDELRNKGIKDISDRTRHFVHYLECFERDIKNPSRYLAERLNERIQDSYDRFSDLIVYHGVNDSNIKQAIRYIKLITYSIKKWEKAGCHGNAPISVANVNLTDELQRKQFLDGLELAGKIINGENIKAYLISDTNSQLREEHRTNLSKILPESKFKDAGHSGVHRLLITRFSRVHLSHHFMRSELSQKEIEAKDVQIGKEGEKAITADLVNLISANTVLDVKFQYQEIASDALTYFRELLFSNEGETPRLYQKDLMPVTNEGSVINSIDNMEKYFKTKENELSLEKDIEVIKHNLSITRGATLSDAIEACRIGSAVYLWNVATMKQLLARISFNTHLLSKFRNEVVKPYLIALREAKESKKLSLAVLEDYAVVFSTIFTTEELREVAKIIFSMIFDPTQSKINMPEKIKIFIWENKSIIQEELYGAIDNYIKETSNCWDAITSDTIFKYGDIGNQRGYALIRVKELLAETAANETRMAKTPRELTAEFISYLASKNDSFTFEERQLKEAFHAYSPEEQKETNFWREAIDQLACKYYTSEDGRNFIRTGRKAHIIFLLNKVDLLYEQGIEAINAFYIYTQEHGNDIQVSQEEINLVFDNFFTDTYQSIDKVEDQLHYLNKAEMLALYFDHSGEWLDKIRLMKIDSILANHLDVNEFIHNIEKIIPFRPFPLTEESKQQFALKLRQAFLQEDARMLTLKYGYDASLNPKIMQLALAFDKAGELIDQIRLADMIAAYYDKLPITDVIKKITTKIDDRTINSGEFIYQFPLTELGQKELNAFFEEVVIPFGRDMLIEMRYQYSEVVEQIALYFDKEQVYLDKIRIAKIASLLKNDDLNETQRYVNNINYTNKHHGKSFPHCADSQQELQELFIASIYPNGQMEEAITQRYAYNVTIEYLVSRYGTEDTKQKCIIARIGDIFANVDSDPNVVESYIQKFIEDGYKNFPNTLKGENLYELNKLLAYYVERPQAWDPSIARLIESFEPTANEGRYVKAYRRKRLAEIFREGASFSKEEYVNYQQLLGVDKTASLNNLENVFGKQPGNKKELVILFQEYITNLLQLWKNKNDYELAVIKQSELFNLAILLIADGLLANEKIPNEGQFKDIQIEGEAVGGKEFYDVWVKLVRDFNKLEIVRTRVDEVKSYLTHGGYKKAKEKYEEAKGHEKNFHGKDEAKPYIRTMEGIVAITREVVKEQVGYQEQLISLQKQVQEIARIISNSTDLNVIREKVVQLVHIFETEIPEFASAALRLPLMALKIREENAKRNMISTRGSSEFASAIELVELIRLLPSENPARSKSIQTIQRFYELLATSDVALETLKVQAKQLVLDFNNALLPTYASRMKSMLDDYTGIKKLPYFKGFDSKDIQKVMEALDDGKTGDIDKAKKILDILKDDIREVYPAFKLLLNESNAEDIHKILLQTERKMIPGMLNELMHFLHDKLLSKQLDSFMIAINDIKAESIDDLPLEKLKVKFKTLINTVGETLQFEAADTQELIAGLAEFKKTSEGNYTATKLRGLLKTLINARDKHDHDNFIEILKQIIELLNLARFQHNAQMAATSIEKAKDKHAITLLLKNINDEQEMRTVKAYARNLNAVNERQYIESMITDMQEEFVLHLPGHVQEDVNYVKTNSVAINDVYKQLVNCLGAKPDEHFSLNLANIDPMKLQFLQKGLNKNRLITITKLLDEAIKEETNNPYKDYLMAVRNYLHQKEADVIGAHKAFKTYTKNFSVLFKNLAYLQTAEYSKFDFDDTINFFKAVNGQLSKLDKKLLLDLISKDKMPENQDINRLMLAQLEGRTVEEVRAQPILERFACYQSVMKKLKSGYHNYDFNKVTAEEVKVLVSKVDIRESTAAVEAMQEKVIEKMSEVVKEGKGAYYKAFREVILDFGSQEEKDKMLAENFKAIIEVFKEKLILYFHSKEHHTKYDLEFMSNEHIEELRFVFANYKGKDKKRLEERLSAQVTNLINALKTSDEDINILIKYGEPFITAFGTEEQKEQLKTLGLLIRYMAAAANKDEYCGLLNIQKTLPNQFQRTEGLEKANELFLSSHEILEGLIDPPDQVIDSILHICKATGIQLVGELNNATLKLRAIEILEQLLNINNTKMRKVVINQELMDDIARVYLFCQVSKFALTSDMAKEVDDALMKFVNGYVKYKEEFKSVPCSTSFASAIINRLTTSETKLKVRKVEETISKEYIKVELKYTAESLIKEIKEQLTKNKGKDQGLELAKNWIKKHKVETLKIKRDQLEQFIEYYNKACDELRIEGAKIIDPKWRKIGEQPLMLTTLKDEIKEKVTSVFESAINEIKRPCRDEATNTKDAHHPSYSYKNTVY